MDKKKNVLVFSNLKSQVNFEDRDREKEDSKEPIHPYIGLRWANVFLEQGIQIDYLNTTPYCIGKKRKWILGPFLTQYFLVPQNYSTVILHSTSGLGKAALIKLLNWKIKVIFYSLSKTNPEGNIIQIILRNTLFFLDCFFAKRIIYGLGCLINEFPIKYFSNKSLYFPFYVDVLFFNKSLNEPLNFEIIPDTFVLVVGDITRDDEYMYDELHSFSFPVIRVSRDKKVIEKANRLFNINRGDKVLSSVSFSELAYLYNKALFCVIASKFDNWQPGGITSIVEALACGGLCLSNSGGEIEKEFNNIISKNNIYNPLFYFAYPQNRALKNLIEQLLKKNSSELNAYKRKSHDFAAECLNFNTQGEKLLIDFINKNL